MTSGFSTIAGSVLGAYIGFGVPAQNLVTSSVMSIPASMSISKMRLPELDEPVTRGRVTVDRGESKERKPVRFPQFPHFHNVIDRGSRDSGQCSPRLQSGCCLRFDRCRPNLVSPNFHQSKGPMRALLTQLSM